MVKYKKIILIFVIILVLAGSWGAYMFSVGQSKAKAIVPPLLASSLITADAHLTIAPESLSFLSAIFSNSRLTAITYLADRGDGKLLKFNFEVNENGKPILSEIYELVPYGRDKLVWQKNEPRGGP